MLKNHAILLIVYKYTILNINISLYRKAGIKQWNKI
jgi:hypothetical protein